MVSPGFSARSTPSTRSRVSGAASAYRKCTPSKTSSPRGFAIVTGFSGSVIVFCSSNTSKRRSVAVRASSRNEKRNPIDSMGQRSTVVMTKNATSSAGAICPCAAR